MHIISEFIECKRLFSFLLFIVAATASLCEVAIAQDATDYLIVPWKRLGPIELGMTAAELLRIMGDPTSTKHGPLDRGVDVYNWKDGLSATITKDGLYVTQICSFNPNYATAQGVHVGSTDLSVVALLGKPRNSRVHSAWWGPSYTDLYWPGLMLSVHLRGFDINHSVWKVCVNGFA
jgi:hypothetical protein